MSRTRTANVARRTGSVGKPVKKTLLRTRNTRNNIAGGNTFRGLSGAHLLKLPSLEQNNQLNTPEIIPSSQLRLAELLGYGYFELLDLGLSGCLEDYLLKSGIGKDHAPLAYSMIGGDFDYVSQYCGDIDHEELCAGEDYFGIFFISDRVYYDIGGDLEKIEERHPGLGRRLLNMLECGPSQIITPSLLWLEADRYFGWEADANGEWQTIEDDEDEDRVTPYKLRSYYPEWALKTPGKYESPLPEDYLIPEWKQVLKPFDEAYHAFRALPKYDDIGWFPQHLADLYGSGASAGAILWTNERNEAERDPAMIAFDDEYDCYMNSEGCHPGTVQFEFLFRGKETGRNLYIKNKMDAWIRNLAAFENLMNAIQKGVFS